MANGKPKKSKKKFIIFGTITILVVVLISIAIFGGSNEEIIPVQVEQVQKRTITQKVTATGKINSQFQVVITPEVTGEIVNLPVVEGQKVRKGDLLIRIKGDIYVAQRDRAEANLKSAKSMLEVQKVQLDQTQRNLKRAEELYNKKLGSTTEYENAKSSYESALANYQSSEASVLQSAASLKEINEQIAKTTILAPMDGTVNGLNVEIGERVLGSGFSQGTNLMTVSDLGSMEATVEVDENDVVLIQIGDTARVKVDAFGDKEFLGVVSEIGNSAKSEGLGTQEQVVNFDVKIKIIDNDEKLRPGMSCNAYIETETIQDVWSVPIQSVTVRDNNPLPQAEEQEGPTVVVDKKPVVEKVKEIVFIIDNNKVKSVPVVTGISDDNYIEVKTGLKGTESVVSGSYKAISKDLNDGAMIRVEDKNKPKEK